jgi:hypothetical protein
MLNQYLNIFRKCWTIFLASGSRPRRRSTTPAAGTECAPYSRRGGAQRAPRRIAAAWQSSNTRGTPDSRRAGPSGMQWWGVGRSCSARRHQGQQHLVAAAPDGCSRGGRHREACLANRGARWSRVGARAGRRGGGAAPVWQQQAVEQTHGNDGRWRTAKKVDVEIK